jgi:PPOX class probable F420-dependent enzyme
MAVIPASHRDLLDAQVAVLGTVGPDGRPQLSGVWFLADADGTIRISLNESRQKLKNVQARPEVSVLVFDPQSQYRYLEVRGPAEVELDADRTFAGQVGAKYSADLAEHDAPGQQRFVVTVRPDHVVTWGG